MPQLHAYTKTKASSASATCHVTNLLGCNPTWGRHRETAMNSGAFHFSWRQPCQLR